MDAAKRAKEFSPLARSKAEVFGLDEKLVCAIISVESNWQPWALRFEPRYKWLVSPFDAFAKLAGTTEATEKVAQSFSYGLLQIMGATARQLGYTGLLSELFDVDTNLLWGLRLLKSLEHRFGPKREDVISAYNRGNPRKRRDGSYFNQTYVDKVLSFL